MAISLKKLMSVSIFRNTYVEQAHFLKRLGTMLEAGFSLRDALLFLETIEEGEMCAWIQAMKKGLGEGNSVIKILEDLNFPHRICAQLYFASERGQFDCALTQVGEQMIQLAEKRKELKQLLHYPLILCVFLIGMLLMLRFYLLPHVTQLLTSSGTHLTGGSKFLIDAIYHSPIFLLVILLIIALIYLYYRLFFKQQSAVTQMATWMRLPLISSYYELYWTYFYFNQWSILIQGGNSLYEIVEMMRASDSSAMLVEIGDLVNQEMKKGVSFHDSLVALPFIRKEAQKIIAHGEESGKMATEMRVFSEHCLTNFNQKLEKLMETIQPLVFIIVALMVVAIYGALMLPTFKMMEGF